MRIPSTGIAALVACFWLTGCLPGSNEVPLRAEDIQPLLTGMTAPAFTLRNPQGDSWQFKPNGKGRPLVLTFYRGGWCPYCNRQLAGLRHAEKQLLELGYEVVFVSADQPEVLQSRAEVADFSYQLFSDNDLIVARQFGIAYQVDVATVTRYQGTDKDLENASGRNHHWLPVPATFIIAADGVIQFSYVNPNYKTRLHPELLLTAARLALQPDEGL